MSLLQIYEPNQTPAPHNNIAVGIDLGTTHSIISIIKDGRPIAIKDDNSSIIPSIVSFLNDDVIVGHKARNLKNISSIKRLMGKNIREAKLLAPNLAEQIYGDNLPYIKVGEKQYNAIEISSYILKYLKNIAENHLGKEIKDAVITVPAYFDDAARQATKDAAAMAGLNVLRLINEPTAAALAYGLDNEAEGIYAIYDFGGGTFDISILRLEMGVFQVLATGGDTNLGGDDIDISLAHKLGISQIEARNIKENGEDAAINECSKPLIDKTISICKSTIKDAGINISEIQDIVLVGGSTKMPLVQSIISNFFQQTALSNLDPDRIVAYGAAIQADNLTNGGNHLLLDVTPLSLGIETMGGLVEKIIHRNSPIPATIAQEFTTYKDGQTAISIHILQGEREMVNDCRSLARFELRNIPPMAAGMAKIKVILTLDADGLLNVSAIEESTGTEQNITIKPSYGLEIAEIEQMIKSSMENAKRDIMERLLQEVIVDAERLISDIYGAIKNSASLLINDEENIINQCIISLRDAINSRHRDKIDEKLKDLQVISAPFAERRMNIAIDEALSGKNIDNLT